jgi:iron complex transport system permease protein
VERPAARGRHGAKHLPLRMILLALLPVVALLVSLPLGRYPISIGDLLHAIAAKLSLVPDTVPQTVKTVIWNVRVPRLLAGLLIGGSLALSGASYQGMFRNPLVSPDILGASAGAGFGAALGIMLSKSILVTELFSFAFGLVAVFVATGIGSRLRKGDPVLTLVLTGLLVGTIFTSLISLFKYLADPYDKLPAITFWLMGSLASVNRQDLLLLLGPTVCGSVLLYLLRWQLNALSFGEEEAQALGVETKKMRTIVIVAATLMTASAVSVCGMIGWVGLVMPHLARTLVGPSYRVLVPASLLLGSSYLLVVDDVARMAGAVEIPLGILTAVIGAPFFLFLLARAKRGWA